MTIPEEFRWATNDGRTLDIRWMDSVHLAHSLNMVIRKNGGLKDMFERIAADGFRAGVPVAHNMIQELKARSLYAWQPDLVMKDGAYSNQLVVPKEREDIKAMCLMRAMWDTATWPGTAWPQDYMKWIHRDMDGLLEHLERTKADEKVQIVLAKFAEYRLERS